MLKCLSNPFGRSHSTIFLSAINQNKFTPADSGAILIHVNPSHVALIKSRKVENMPVVVMGQTYYRTSEACKLAGIARSTLLRWTNAQVTEDAALRDRRGWRLFTRAEVDSITRESQKSQALSQARP
jgi:hypothetical protein